MRGSGVWNGALNPEPSGLPGSPLTCVFFGGGVHVHTYTYAYTYPHVHMYGYVRNPTIIQDAGPSWASPLFSAQQIEILELSLIVGLGLLKVV